MVDAYMPLLTKHHTFQNMAFERTLNQFQVGFATENSENDIIVRVRDTGAHRGLFHDRQGCTAIALACDAMLTARSGGLQRGQHVSGLRQ